MQATLARSRRATRCPLRRIADKRSSADTSPAGRLQAPVPEDAPDEPEAEHARDEEADAARAGGFREHAAPPSAKTPMIAEPSRPPRMTTATAIRFVALSMWSSISSMPGFSMCTWNVPWRSCSRTSETWYGMSRATEAEPDRLDARALRERARVEAVDEQPARIRLRDLEHVELRIDLLADRGERRDRLVEDDEAARELQVHRVDELEALADHLERVDVREPAAVVAVEENLELASELLLARWRRSGRRAREGVAGSRRRSPSQRRRRAA